MDKSELQSLINAKSDRVTYESNSGKLTSDVWQHFVCVKVDGAMCEFVKCIKCHHVLKWKSRDGTHGLKVHVESCGSKLPTRSILDLPGFARPKQPAAPSTVKSDVADAIVKMCAKDIRPFSLVEGDGFIDLAD